MSPFSRSIRRAAAVLLGLALGLVAGEGLARRVFPAPLPERLPLARVQANAARGWEMVPGESHFTYHHRVSINSLGLRGPEVEPRREGELRLLALGDSLVYGQGVADDQTLPVHLQAVLAERTGRPVTVVNAGLRAYSTPQELGLLRELGERIDPDLVVLFWYWNDLDQQDLAQVAARLEASGPIAFDLGAAPEGWPLLRWRLVQLVRRSVLAMQLHDLLRDETQLAWLERADERLALLPGQLSAFREAAEALGAEFAAVVIPKPGALVGSDPSTPIVDRARTAAGTVGIELPVLEDGLKRLTAASGLPIVPYDGHYSGPGNRALAVDAALWLAELGLLDDAPGSDPKKTAAD